MPAYSSPEFQVGQTWSYKTRPQDPLDSTFTLFKIDEETGEQLHNHQILHLRIDRVRMNSKKIQVQHMPFTRESLEESVVQLLKEEPTLKLDDEGFLGSYNNWKKESEEGKAG